ncbi:MAG TPA: DUF1080 domain-containing protein [Planctomycetota bacterium]|nr:DUF1080 domain-containing protein [Planctomycetota bacterium]
MRPTAPDAATGLLVMLASCQGPPRPSPWHELFDGSSLGQFVSTDFGGQGEVTVRDGRLQLGIGSPLTGVTWTGPLPPAEYELEVTARRDVGSDFFCGLTFPVGDSHLTLVLGGWGGSVCGLSSLDGLDAAHNDTRRSRYFAPGRDYTARISVMRERVVVTLDDGGFLEVELAGRVCGLRPEVLLSRPLGLASFLTVASVRSCRWRALQH